MIKQVFIPVRNTKISRAEAASRFTTTLWPHKDSIFWNVQLKLLTYGIPSLLVSRWRERTPPGAFPALGKATSFLSFQPVSSSIGQFQRFAKDKVRCSTAINRLLRAIEKHDQIQGYSEQTFLQVNKQFPRLLILTTAFTFNPLPPGSTAGCKTMTKKVFTFEQQLDGRFSVSLALSTSRATLRGRAPSHHWKRRMHPPTPTSYRDGVTSNLARKRSHWAAWCYQHSSVFFPEGKYSFIVIGFDSFPLMFNHCAGRRRFQIWEETAPAPWGQDAGSTQAAGPATGGWGWREPCLGWARVAPQRSSKPRLLQTAFTEGLTRMQKRRSVTLVSLPKESSRGGWYLDRLQYVYVRLSRERIH